MKFSDLVAGKKATRVVTITLHDQELKLQVTPLSATEEITADAYAIRFAKDNGAEPNDDSQIYRKAIAAQTIALAYMTPENAEQPFFDGGAAQVLTLDTDTIAYLMEHQEYWQAETSPGRKLGKNFDLLQLTHDLGEVGDDSDPLLFLRISPTTRARLVPFMAVQARESLAYKRWRSSNSGASPSETTKSDTSAKPSDEPSNSRPAETPSDDSE